MTKSTKIKILITLTFLFGLAILITGFIKYTNEGIYTEMALNHPEEQSSYSIRIDNYEFKLGEFFDVTQDITNMQEYIDEDNIAVAWTELNVNDGLATHISAHNPGRFTPMYKAIKLGSKITAIDKYNNKKVYTVIDKRQIQFPVKDNKEATQLYNDYINKESLVIQFCVGKYLTFYIAE